MKGHFIGCLLIDLLTKLSVHSFEGQPGENNLADDVEDSIKNSLFPFSREHDNLHLASPNL